MDNCWDYNGGVSEVRMGKALADGYRDKVFLMTKIDGRTKAEAARQIDESLQRLQTDHVDLMQFHEVIRLEDPDRIFAEGGAMEAMLEAKKAGKVRFIGFTGHKDPLVHLRMLDTPAPTTFILTPCRCRSTSWTPTSAASAPGAAGAGREGIAPLGMKAFGDHVHPRQQDGRRPSSACTIASTCPSPCRSPASTARQFSIRPLKRCEPSSPVTETQVASLLERPSMRPRAANTNPSRPPAAMTAQPTTPSG